MPKFGSAQPIDTSICTPMLPGMKRYIFCAILFLPLLACSLPERKQIWIVGSSTLYPFIAAAAEQFGRSPDYATPIVEATGTGGGIKLFCEGVGLQNPDIVNASRQMKEKEVSLCHDHGVTEISEFPIGFDGIVLANLKSSPRYHLTRQQLFLALAKVLPDESGKLVPNTYKYWSDISHELPQTQIAVYGPPPTSGTRDAFVELVMEVQCKNHPAFVSAFPDEEKRKQQCHQLREDGHFIDAGENDNIIVQKLQNNPTALGIFGYSFLEQNADSMQGSLIEGVSPEFDRIADGSYPVSRSLYIYVKKQHISLISSLKNLVKEIVSEEASGSEGYLAYKGLIPLPEASRKINQKHAAQLR